VSIFESSKGYLTAGYTSLSWNSTQKGVKGKGDDDAFLCALTNQMQIFRPAERYKAVTLSINCGPYWFSTFGVCGNLMNRDGGGYSETNNTIFNIPTDS